MPKWKKHLKVHSRNASDARRKKKGIFVKNYDGSFKAISKANPLESLSALKREVKDFAMKNMDSFQKYRRDDLTVADCHDAIIKFSNVPSYKDFRTYRILYQSDGGAHATTKMNKTQINTLLDIVYEDVQMLFGDETSCYEITEMLLIGFGMDQQPYHMDDEAKSPPVDNEHSIHPGLLIYNLSPNDGESYIVELKVLRFGEGHIGYCPTTEQIFKDEFMWISDYMIHAGGVHSDSCVRLHIHINPVGSDRSQNGVYVIKKSQFEIAIENEEKNRERILALQPV